METEKKAGFDASNAEPPEMGHNLSVLSGILAIPMIGNTRLPFSLNSLAPKQSLKTGHLRTSARIYVRPSQLLSRCFRGLSHRLSWRPSEAPLPQPITARVAVAQARRRVGQNRPRLDGYAVSCKVPSVPVKPGPGFPGDGLSPSCSSRFRGAVQGIGNSGFWPAGRC
jgi:hypothetical protein